jgi:hypothetical protein
MSARSKSPKSDVAIGPHACVRDNNLRDCIRKVPCRAHRAGNRILLRCIGVAVGIATGIALTGDGITRVPIGAGGGDAPVSLHYRLGISPPNPFP